MTYVLKTSGKRVTRRLVSAVVGTATMALLAGDVHAQSEEEQRIWDRADTAIMEYMRESAGVVGQGYAIAYTGYGSWYINEFLPLLDDEPPLARVFKFAFEQAVKSGSGFLPVPPPFGKLAGQFFIAAFREASASGADPADAGYIATLLARIENARTLGLTLARRFETEHPSDFEAAMTAYLDEEIETAGIHAASDFGLGEHTRKTLRGLGFPEPSDDGARVVAEKVLIPMVLATKKRYQPQAARILDAEQIRIDANITARRILWPNNPERYCEGAFELGMLAPDDCR